METRKPTAKFSLALKSGSSSTQLKVLTNAFNVQHSTLNAQRSTPNVQLRLVRRWAFGVERLCLAQRKVIAPNPT
jgi:hypothetical protein